MPSASAPPGSGRPASVLPIAEDPVDRTVRLAVAKALHAEPPTQDRDPLSSMAAMRARQLRVPRLYAAATGADDEHLLDAIDQDAHAVLRQVRELHHLADLFADAGVRWLALKGPALAVQTGQPVTARGFGDVDILIDPDDAGKVHRLLVSGGWRPDPGWPEPSGWAWAHVQRSYSERVYVGPTGELDLHWRLDPSPGALPAFEDCWRTHVEVSILGVDVPTLAPPVALAFASSHAARDDWKGLRNPVDVWRLMQLVPASQWPRRRVDRITFALVVDLLGLPPGVFTEHVAAAPARGVRSAWEVRAAASSARRFGRGWHHSKRLLRSAAGPADFVRVLSGRVLPPQAVADFAVHPAPKGVARALVRKTTRLLRRT